ncbi:VOC family protein [Dermatobacter hominis]|uniref:VOC family protein n=1 Tax=Dermatobacter hominis TaxID=2884263 RepID=UPI001D1045E3|nr:VOC family protein [Dermatobacter hominis]UDY34123.1 VOC family protein [Dermatobacter hominis]
MEVNRSVPPATVVPILVYPDVRAAVTFLTEAFGFVERTRIGASHRAQMAVGDDGAVIVADVGADRRAPAPGGTTHTVRVRVPDVDTAFARARDHGAVVVEAPVDREYGERDCTLEDPAGHRWQFAEVVADVAPEEFGCETVSPWPAYRSTGSG